jgi:GAT domain
MTSKLHELVGRQSAPFRYSYLNEVHMRQCQGSVSDCLYIRGTRVAVQADLSVAAENATLLKDLLQTVEAPADVSSDPVVGSLVQRCRVVQGGVQRVIQKIHDESVMAAALQVPPCHTLWSNFFCANTPVIHIDAPADCQPCASTGSD